MKKLIFVKIFLLGYQWPMDEKFGKVNFIILCLIQSRLEIKLMSKLLLFIRKIDSTSIIKNLSKENSNINMPIKFIIKNMMKASGQIKLRKLRNTNHLLKN